MWVNKKTFECERQINVNKETEYKWEEDMLAPIVSMLLLKGYKVFGAYGSVPSVTEEKNTEIRVVINNWLPDYKGRKFVQVGGIIIAGISGSNFYEKAKDIADTCEEIFEYVCTLEDVNPVLSLEV